MRYQKSIHIKYAYPGLIPKAIKGLAGLLIALILPFYPFYAQVIPGAPLQFENLTVENGLLHTHMICLSQDAQGYLWLGSFGGLQRFDGTTFDNYLSEDSTPGRLADPNIYCTFHDSRQRLWVGSEKGLSLFQPHAQTFKNFNHPSYGFGHNALREIVEDKHGKLWIATYGKGIACFDPETEKIVAWYKPELKNLGSLYVNTLRIDKSGKLWAGLESKGLECWNEQTHRFEPKFQDLANETINSIQQDQQGILWVGTWSKGLCKLNLVTGETKCYTAGRNQVPDNTIRQIAIDRDNKLWLATINGLGQFDPLTEKCLVYRNEKNNPNSLSFDFLWSVMIDRQGIVWIGTFGNGLGKLDPAKNKFHLIRSDHSDCKVEYNYVDFISKDLQERLWVASSEGGISIYNTTPQCAFQNPVPHKLPAKKYRSFYESKDGTLWLGTDEGLIRSDSRLQQITSIPLSDGKNGLSVFAIQEDQEGNLWFGGWNTGLLMLPAAHKNDPNINPQHLVIYNNTSAKDRYIPYNTIWAFCLDSRQQLWVANEHALICRTSGASGFDIRIPAMTNICNLLEYPQGKLWVSNMANGLSSLDLEGKGLKHHTLPETQGKASVYTFFLRKDKLWLGTEKGLFWVDPHTLQSRRFTTHDGLPVNNFMRNTGLALKEGSILLGTPKGMMQFKPEEILNHSAAPIPRLCDIRLFNKSISHQALLTQNVSTPQTLTLEYHQNIITFVFSALQHSLPQKTRYVYTLEGFNNEWIEPAKGVREATFTNLDPGSYTFRLKTLDANGKPGDSQATYQLVILPPWWKTLWFRALMLMALVASVIATIMIRTRAIRRSNERLQQTVQQRTLELKETNEALTHQNLQIQQKSDTILEQQKELLDQKYTLEKTNEKLSEWNDFQQKLIGIISHDIRGPLQRMGALHRLLDDEVSRPIALEKLKETTLSLNHLATDLLNWISLQSSKAQLQLEPLDLQDLTAKMVEEARQYAPEKNLTFTIRHQSSGEPVYGVQTLVMAACRNILNNAVKHSPTNGVIEIEIAALVNDTHLALRITDDGPGIEKVELMNEQINREGFADALTHSLHAGAGLGLTICNYMLKKMNGWIEAASLPGSGATFYLYIPKTAKTQTLPQAQASIEHPAPPRSELLKHKTILLVEDDDDIRWDILKVLQNHTRVYETRSAEEAVDWLMVNNPDLCLIDIQMKGMSGIELCRQIKQSTETSHVPCILVSGQNTEETRLQAFNSGADKFIPKPVTPEELLLQIQLYFQHQEKQLKRFFTENISVDEFTDNALSRVFLSKLLQIIEKNIASPDLSVEQLGKEIGMSKSGLYRHLKSLTGQSPNQFIISIRMRRSLHMLKESKKSIEDIASENGFSSSYYFIRAFKKHFGFNPGDLRE